MRVKTLLFFVSITFVICGYSQKDVTTFGVQLKPIVPMSIIGFDEDSATELLWLHMKEEEYQMPPKNYVPDDPKWRIEGEDYEDWKKVRKNIMVMDQYIWRKK